MRVLLAGGGSGGSVTPLLAVAQRLRQRDPNTRLLLIGTAAGPEADLAEVERIPFVAIPSGKLRRYWDVQNLSDIARIVDGYLQSLALVRSLAPDVAIGAGGFASVPPLYACATLGVPTIIHQQDVAPGLANRLLSSVASRITVAMPETLRAFPDTKTVLRGNPVRASVAAGQAANAIRAFDLDDTLPLVVITGGGTGALALNRIVAQAAVELVAHCQVVHLTGRNRAVPTQTASVRYRQVEFLTSGMPDLVAAAALVVTRAGMGTLSELGALGKAAVVVPMPSSHQDANAAALRERDAAIIVDERSLTAAMLCSVVASLLDDEPKRSRLGRALQAALPLGAAEMIAEDVLQVAGR